MKFAGNGATSQLETQQINKVCSNTSIMQVSEYIFLDKSMLNKDMLVELKKQFPSHCNFLARRDDRSSKEKTKEGFTIKL